LAAALSHLSEKEKDETFEAMGSEEKERARLKKKKAHCEEKMERKKEIFRTSGKRP